ncbi:hypothetical protein [Tenacibaculum ovolyticum]|uniref:hypothetical protein n=1 Tax=Tenacibaculum ovolyticum TaxID=104270 RepID=UPI0007EC3ED7|nr:hypothetical protein [Tenacibaculum ovolyticum]
MSKENIENVEKKKKDNLPFVLRIIFSLIIFIPMMFLLYDYAENSEIKKMIIGVSGFLGVLTFLYLVYKFFIEEIEKVKQYQFNELTEGKYAFNHLAHCYENYTNQTTNDCDIVYFYKGNIILLEALVGEFKYEGDNLPYVNKV